MAYSLRHVSSKVMRSAGVFGLSLFNRGFYNKVLQKCLHAYWLFFIVNKQTDI